ncbi:MAG: alpha/beta fold hydrolase [Hyphomonadaceae bacterium]
MSDFTEASTSRHVQAGKIRVHFNDAGEGPCVILLHGGGAGASGWGNFWRNVGPLAENHRVLLVDQLGFAGTGHWDDVANNSENNARMLADLLDVLKIERASLVGNSMGGVTAMNFAIDYPDRTHRVVQMGSAVGVNTSIFMPIPTEGQKVLAEAARNPTVETLSKLFSLMVYDSSFVTKELLETRVAAALATRRPENFKPGAPMQRDLTHELRKCVAKTLIVWGRDDRVVPLDAALRLLWGLPDAQLHVYPNCGHWVQYEHADAFNRLILDFLDE